MNDRPKLTIKKPLSIEKQSQLFQALKPLQVQATLERAPYTNEQVHKDKEAQKKKREETKAALLWLSEQFSTCFNLKEIKPLKLHIDKDIYPYLEKEGSPSRIKIRLALKYYTQNINYIKALINGTHRYDLKGQPVEEITQEQRDFTHDKLEKILQSRKTKKQHKIKTFSQEEADIS